MPQSIADRESQKVQLSQLSRPIRRRAIWLLTSVLLAPSVAFAEFCAIDNFGNVSNCFPSADMCRNWIRSWVGGGCVFRQGATGGGGGQSDFDNAMNTLREVGKQRKQEADSLRANTPDFLLPLSPSAPMSRETVAIITSTLMTALEMDAGRSKRDWRNPSTGAQGAVLVDAQSTNQYGSICRKFAIAMGTFGSRKGVHGNACRIDGNWKVLGSMPLEAGK